MAEAPLGKVESLTDLDGDEDGEDRTESEQAAWAWYPGLPRGAALRPIELVRRGSARLTRELGRQDEHVVPAKDRAGLRALGYIFSSRSGGSL